MSDIESRLATGQDLVCLAQKQGIDVDAICHSGSFLKDERVIWFWRKDNLVHYSLQGKIGLLPNAFKESASAFHGMWTEAGTVENTEEALEFLKAWLLDRKEVDDLPKRWIRRCGIG